MKTISTKLVLLTIFVILLVTVFPAAAGTVTTINFDNLADRELVTIQYSGLTFLGPNMILKYPNYNYDGYPAHSGENVLDVSGGSIRIDFTTPVSRVGTWYSTAYSGAFLEAYDSEGALIKSTSGGPSYTYSSYIELSGSNIAYVIIHDSGGWFTIDDLTYETPDTSIPEYPSIVLPIAAIMGLMFIFQRRRE